ncbi:hypothetical protein [Streptomyces nigrescens]
MRALRRTAAGASSRPPPTTRRPADSQADTGDIRVPAASVAHAATRPPGRSGSGHYPNQFAVDIHMLGTCGSNYLTEDDLPNLHISNNDAATLPVGPTAIAQSRYFTGNQPLRMVPLAKAPTKRSPCDAATKGVPAHVHDFTSVLAALRKLLLASDDGCLKLEY